LVGGVRPAPDPCPCLAPNKERGERLLAKERGKRLSATFGGRAAVRARVSDEER